MEYIDKALLQYPTEDQLLSSTILDGFQDAMEEMEDTSLDDIDLAYNMLYIGQMTLPGYKGTQFHVIAITLAKFFVQKFHSLPVTFMRQFNCITNLNYRIDYKKFWWLYMYDQEI